MDNNLPAVQNQGLAKQDLKHLKTGEEKFGIAIQGEKIVNSPVENLKEVLRVAMLKLGIRGHNLPTEEEKYILLQHITENYGNHTPNEISLAFELALAGQLDIEADEVKAYENFSCLYFSIVMNSYRKWTSSQYHRISEKKKRLELPLSERRDLSDEEMQEWINEWDIDKFMAMDGIEHIPLLFYDFLVKKGEINLTNEQKKEFLDRAVSIKEGELFRFSEKYTMRYYTEAYVEFKNQKLSKEFSESNMNQLKNLAKKVAVFEYFKIKLNVANI